MICNPKAGSRGGPAARLLVIMAIMASLVSGACASPDGQAPAADGPPPTLREALSPDQLARVALVDRRTPFPAAAGRAAVFVDGDFYAQAGDAVRAYVRERLQEGLPVVFFGDQPGYEALRGSVGAAADLPAEPAPEAADGDTGSSGPVNPAAAARGLTVYPSPGPNELRRSAAIEVSGPPDNLAPLVDPLLRWAEECSGDPG